MDKRIFAGIAGALGFGAAAMEACNRLIDRKALGKNVLSDDEGSYFPGKYGAMYYRVTGSGSPVLLIHNADAAASGADWDQLVSKLSGKHTVYVPDLPGCGRSDKPSAAYTNFVFVDALKEFVQECVPQKGLTAVASGIGCSILLMAAVYDTSLFSRLVFINPPTATECLYDNSRKAKILKVLFRIPVVGRFLYHLRYSWGNIDREYTRKLFYDPDQITDELVDAGYEASHRKESRGRFLLAGKYASYLNLNCSFAVGRLQIPALLLEGEHCYTSETDRCDWAELNPSIQRVVIPATKKLPHIEDPERTEQEIEQYLAANPMVEDYFAE